MTESNEDPQKKLTPEERLFKIIQDAEKAPEDETLVVSSKAAAAADAPVPALEPAAETEEHAADVNLKKATRAAKLGSLQSDTFWRDFRKNIVSIPTLNRALSVVLAGLIAYCVSVFMFKDPAAERFAKRGESAFAAPQFPANLLPTGSYDFSTFASRNLFQPWRPPPPPEPSAAAAQGSAAPTPQLSSALSNLKLSGVYIGDDPEALIEAIDEKKTYTVSKGSEIKGLKVVEVQPDGVLLTDGNSQQLLR